MIYNQPDNYNLKVYIFKYYLYNSLIIFYFFPEDPPHQLKQLISESFNLEL